MNEEEVKRLLLSPPGELRPERPVPAFNDVTTVAELRKVMINRGTPILASIIEDKEGKPLGALFLIQSEEVSITTYDKIKEFILKQLKPYFKKEKGKK